MAKLEKMSLRQLEDLQVELDAARAAKASAEREAVKARLIQEAKDAGFSIEELFGKGRKSGGKVAPKYRNPKNAAETWTGRGRRPLWLEAALKKRGSKIEDFLI